MRCVEMQLCPAWEKPPTRTFFATSARSASASTMSGELEPSSSFTFLRGALAPMPQPTSPRSGRGGAHRHALAAEPPPLRRRDGQRVDAAPGLDGGGADRLARLERDRPRELLDPPAQQLGRDLEHADPLVLGEVAPL